MYSLDFIDIIHSVSVARQQCRLLRLNRKFLDVTEVPEYVPFPLKKSEFLTDW